MIEHRHLRLVVAVTLVVVGLLAIVIPAAGQTISSPPPQAAIPDCPADDAGADPGANAPASSPATNAAAAASPGPGEPSSVPATTPRRTRTGTLDRWDGRWATVASRIAIVPRTDAIVAVEAGRQMGIVIWGGVGPDGRLLNDGARVDESGVSMVLPAAPICPRRDFAWTYDWFGNLVIWGGIDQAGQPLRDGAFYSFTYGIWRLLPLSPLPAGPAAMAGDSNDLFVVGTDPATGLAELAIAHHYDYEEGGTWEGAFDVPLPRGERYQIIHCCEDGTAWVTVFSIQPGGFAVAAMFGNLSGSRFEWTQFGRVPLPADSGGPGTGRTLEEDRAAWIGASDVPYPGTDLTGVFGLVMRADEPGRPWRMTSPVPEAAAGDPTPVLSPSHLISVQGMVAYDLVHDRWVRLPRRSDVPRFGPPVGATAWWYDGRLWVFGGRTPDGSMESRLWAFTPDPPRSATWLPTEPAAGGYLDGCVAVGVTGKWQLRGDPDDRRVAWVQRGPRRQATHWPDGWYARSRPRLEIVDSAGRVRARDGDVCRTDPGTGG